MLKKKVGKLIKKEIKYIDESSGSEFVLVFGAMTENDFQKFFSENEVILKGITEVQKKEILNQGIRI